MHRMWQIPAAIDVQCVTESVGGAERVESIECNLHVPVCCLYMSPGLMEVDVGKAGWYLNTDNVCSPSTNGVRALRLLARTARASVRSLHVTPLAGSDDARSLGASQTHHTV